MTAFVDTNHLVKSAAASAAGTYPLSMSQARTATPLYLADLIVAETVYVLESFYKAPRDQVATAMRSLIAMRSMITVDPALLLRAIEVYEVDRLDFAEAYIVACAETAGVGTIASFDKAIDRVTTVTRREP